MKHHLPSLDALKVFESAARHLSFSLAAQELCLSKGAVSYQIRKLEASLDCALFRRSIRQVYLTKTGQQLLQTTQHLFSELTHTLEQMKPEVSSHDVVIGATTYVALRWLSSRISGFTERYPEVSILLQHPVNSDDFRMQDVDFAIQWGHMTGCNKRGLLLELPMPLFPVCSPQLFDRYDRPEEDQLLDVIDLTGAAFESTPLLCEDRSLDIWRLWYGKQARPLTNPRRVIADANVRTQAAVDGQGWTLADALMQPELDSGLLVAPFNQRLDGYGYAIQTYPGRFVSQNALVLRQWLIDHV